MIKRNMSLMQKITQNIKRHFKFSIGLRNACADEGEAQGDINTEAQPVTATQSTQPTQPQSTSPSISFEQLIASARREEKSKLYPQIEKLKAEKEALVVKQNDLLLQLGDKDATIQELKKQLEASQKGKVDPQEVKALKEKVSTLEAENSQLKTEKEQAKLEDFKKSEIAKVNGQVIPELVTGTTEEEIKASIELANKRYMEIVSNAGVTQTSQAPTSPAPSTFSAGSTPFGLDFSSVTPEMIANMSIEEYTNYRKQIGLL